MMYCKRIYDAPSPTDGKRVLVDRLWPRGFTKQQLMLDTWLKEATPSTTLRQWYHQHLEQQQTFKQRYLAELSAQPDHWLIVLDWIRQGNVTLLSAAKNTQFNHALILAEFLEDEMEKWQERNSPVCYANTTH